MRKLHLATEYLTDARRKLMLPKLFLGLRLKCLQIKKLREIDEINEHNAIFFERMHTRMRLMRRCMLTLKFDAKRAAFMRRK